MSNQYPTHTERNHRRAQRFEARKATYNQPAIDTQAQAKRWRLDDLLSDAGRDHPNNPALVKVYKGGWIVCGGAGGRGKTIARTASSTLDNALYLAAVVSDAGYHITNPELLTVE